MRVDATNAEADFDGWLEHAQSDLVEVMRDGKLAAILLSPEALDAVLRPRQAVPRDRLARLMQESIKRHGKVYESLAEWERRNEPPKS